MLWLPHLGSGQSAVPVNKYDGHGMGGIESQIHIETMKDESTN